jgi:hypothetical protein
MATWPHISAKNKTDVLQEGLPTGSEGGLYIAGCTKHRWQSEPPSPGKNVMCTRWDTLNFLPHLYGLSRTSQPNQKSLSKRLINTNTSKGSLFFAPKLREPLVLVLLLFGSLVVLTQGTVVQTTSTHPFHQCGTNGSDAPLSLPRTSPLRGWRSVASNSLFILALLLNHNFVQISVAFSCPSRVRECEVTLSPGIRPLAPTSDVCRL